MAFEPRRYRAFVSASDLVHFQAVHAETDLQVLAERDLGAETRRIIAEVREPLERYIASHPRFGEAFAPVPVEPTAPPIVGAMARAGRLAGVGPMAAVAGAVAQAVAEQLAPLSAEVLVENGGDLYLIGERERTVALWAGERGARGIGIRVHPEQLPCAVATSSGRVGHSVSFGDADAVTVIARDGALADAVATATANRVRRDADAQSAIERAREVPGVEGVLITVDGSLAAWGALEIVDLRDLKPEPGVSAG